MRQMRSRLHNFEICSLRNFEAILNVFQLKLVCFANTRLIRYVDKPMQ